VTVRTVIMSMSLMSALDWAQFFESVSLVDEVLRAGPKLRRDGLRDPRRLSHAARRARAGLRAPRAGGRAPDHGVHASVPVGQTTTGNAIRASISSARGAGHRADDRLPGPRECAGCSVPTVAAATPGYLATIAVSSGGRVHAASSRRRASGVGTVSLLILGIAGRSPARTWRLPWLNEGVTRFRRPGRATRLDLRDGVPPRLRTMGSSCRCW